MDREARILVVDDDSGIRSGIRDLLSLQDFIVVIASNGLEALDLLADQTPDLILADIIMPKMDGYQLYQRVRQNPEWLQIPFIFLSVKGDEEDIRFGKELGVDDYLMKPINPEDLISAVVDCLQRYRQMQIQNSCG